MTSDQVERVLEAIQSVVNSGKIGGGKIFLYELGRSDANSCPTTTL